MQMGLPAAAPTTLSNQMLLNCRKLFVCNFNTHVTTANHNAFTSFANFFNIIYTCLIFNLCNEVDIFTVIFFQKLLYI